MPRQMDYRATSTYPAETVYATMVDPAFLRARLRRIGGPGADLLEHTADGTGVRYRLRHGLDASDLPAAVRGAVPGNLAIERTEGWTRQDGGYLGQVQVIVQGTPASATGGMRLQDASEAGSVFQVRADVVVRVPLFGAKIEGIVADQIQRLLTAESAFTERWLAQAR